MTEEKKADKGALLQVIITVVCIAGVGGIAVGAESYPHFYGATAENIANVALGQTTRGVARALPCSHEHDKSVKTTFRHSVVGFESATFSWDQTSDQVSGIKLEATRDHESSNKNGKERSDAPRPLAGKLDDFVPGVTSYGERKWGAVRFRASDSGDLSFDVSASGDGHTANPLFARQVEAAREILVAVAFDIQPSLSKQDLADLIATGYALAEVAKVNPDAAQADTMRTLTTKFPAAIVPNEKDRIRIPILNSVVADIELKWSTFWRTKARFEVSFHVRRTFTDKRAAFMKCIAGKVSSTSASPADTFYFNTDDRRGIDITVQPDGVSTTPFPGGIDAASFASALAAIDVCGNQ